MIEVENRALYERAIKQWGMEAQVRMAIEEAGELIVVLAKLRRNYHGSQVTDLIGEVADNQIMLEQLQVIFGVENLVRSVKEKKMKRLREMLK